MQDWNREMCSLQTVLRERPRIWQKSGQFPPCRGRFAARGWLEWLLGPPLSIHCSRLMSYVKLVTCPAASDLSLKRAGSSDSSGPNRPPVNVLVRGCRRHRAAITPLVGDVAGLRGSAVRPEITRRKCQNMLYLGVLVSPLGGTSPVTSIRRVYGKAKRRGPRSRRRRHPSIG